MRILFTTANPPSHIRALVPVAQAARQAGHTVALATAATAEEEIESYGLEHLVAGADLFKLLPKVLREHGLTFAELASPEHSARVFAGRPALDMARDVIQADWEPDLVVRSSLELGGALAAEVLGIPHASVAISGATPSILRPPELVRMMAPLRGELGLPFDTTGSASFRHLHACLTPESYDEAELRLPNTKLYRHSSPVRLGEVLPPDLTARLLDDRPVVYGSLGTLASVAGEEGVLDELIAALGQMDCVAVVATAGQAARIASTVPPNVVLMDRAPQPLLLECCDLFVTHAGHNSIRESLRCGVPVVCVPLFAEQPHNARRCVEIGVGETVPQDEATVDGIAAMCRKVLGDSRYRSRARRIQRDMLALPPLDVLIADLEQLVRTRSADPGLPA